MKLYLYWILLGKRKNLNILKSDTFKQILKKLPSSKRNKYKIFFLTLFKARKIFRKENWIN